MYLGYLGSVIAVQQRGGALSETYRYSAYGEITAGEETGQPFRFTGRRYDPETGLYYYRARYYSPILGRFLQTDPIGYGDNMNMYAYVANDPVNAKDPTGEDRVDGRCCQSRPDKDFNEKEIQRISSKKVDLSNSSIEQVNSPESVHFDEFQDVAEKVTGTIVAIATGGEAGIGVKAAQNVPKGIRLAKGLSKGIKRSGIQKATRQEQQLKRPESFDPDGPPSPDGTQPGTGSPDNTPEDMGQPSELQNKVDSVARYLDHIITLLQF